MADCGCFVDRVAEDISYCPLHQAAPAMLKALEAWQLHHMVEPNPFGHNCEWCGDCLNKLHALRREALAQARGD